MQTNDHQIRNYDIVLDETFGKPGSPERAKAEEEAIAKEKAEAEARAKAVADSIARVHAAERAKAEEEAYNFYSGQILQDARKEAKISQMELAQRANTTKNYISQIEKGIVTPSVGMFYRIIAALGMRVEIVKPIY